MEGTVKFLDGSQILQKLSADDDDRLQALFQEATGTSPTKKVDAAQCRAVAISYIHEPMCGVPLPDQFLDRALAAAHFPPDLTTSMDQASFSSKLRDLLQSISAELKEKPLVVSILDGAGIKAILEDEDDFAMLAENLFTGLDVEDTGKISPSSLQTALLQMGFEMGVPDPSGSEEAEQLILSVLEKHKSDGQESIGQAQFAKLLQETLEDLADGLAQKPIVAKLDLNVNNGSQLKKMLADPELFSKAANKIFDDSDSSKDGKLNRSELRHAFEKHGEEWGLPPLRNSSEHVAQLYSDLFSVCDADNSGEIDKNEFRSLLQEILEVFADKLESNPIFLS